MVSQRDEDEEVHTFVSPFAEMNAGLWCLFIGATAFLAMRLYVKLSRRHRLWYDDHILIVCWVVLLANNSLIVHEFATGYILPDSSHEWDDRMHILINISSCGTLIGQALTKTAFAVTLLRLSNDWQKWLLWFCIATMNAFMISKVIIQWAKVCGEESYQNWYRLDFCIESKTRDDFKEGGNVYNIIMDFLFASLPWILTRPLVMRKMEKIGLCVAMSLGMIVAIVSAIRVSWKDKGNDRDEYYIYRNGLSQVWYSSEITGTIIVQCIPVLRTLLRQMHSTWSTKRRSNASEHRASWTRLLARRPSIAAENKLTKRPRDVADEKEKEVKISVSHIEGGKQTASSSLYDSEPEKSAEIWPLAPAKPLQIYTTKSFETRSEAKATPILDWDAEQGWDRQR